MVGLLFIGYVQAQNLKIGYVDGASIYSQLPEVKAAQSQLETFGKQLQKNIQDKQGVFQRKYEEYQKNGTTMTEGMRTATEKELQGLQEQLQIAQQDAQQQLQKREGELLKPIEEKIQKSYQRSGCRKQLYVCVQQRNAPFLPTF
ncbi:MAG: OmpH family outer membrane protein [Lewinella sp.]|nr:OmpH family outer membrane protein [Lewinella sp.]